MPAVEKNLKRDLSTLLKLIDFRRVPEEHPLRRLWSSPSSEARFELHHLADDLRILHRVEGFLGLLKQLLESADTYEDFRYEVRLAGALGRPAGQHLRRLGGDKAGPDIELTTASGHLCGVACYRANSATPAVADVPKQMQAIAKAFAPAIGTFAPSVRILHEVIFPTFPVRENFVEAAVLLLTALWNNPGGHPELSAPCGVKVRRLAAAGSTASTASIRFLFPVPAREAFRLDRHVREKVEKENRWAASYPGVAVFAMEQPTLGHDLDQDMLRGLLSSPSNGLAAVFMSRAFFPDDPGLRHRMEHLQVVVHPDLETTNFNVGIETFGDNIKQWAGDEPYVELKLDHAWEEWELRLERGQVQCDRRLPLSIVRHAERLGPLSDGLVPADAAFLRRTEEAVQRMMDNLKMK